MDIFKLKENNTTIKTEIIAGFTTFFTMSYLLILSPKILEFAGLDFGSTLTVTALFVFIASTLMAFIANKLIQ
jgi:AGZA family xanthine/uracil permease-like MFS transporter